jgi:glycolate oxidase FAD binding subunit
VDLSGVPVVAPASRAEVVDALRRAGAEGRRLLPVGGGTHLAKGNPTEVDAALALGRMQRVVEYEPAEMLAVVEAGCRFGELDALLAGHGQEWPVDAPPQATVGGIVAAGISSPRRLRVGPVRDTVLEVEAVTGDGRPLRAGGRTVKNVSGFDLCRLFTGSLGTLAVITQVALKLRPRPPARRTVTAPGGLDVAARLLDGVPLPAAVLATPHAVELRLEGWPDDVAEQTRLAAALLGDHAVHDDAMFPVKRPWEAEPVVAEVAVAPSRLREVVRAVGQAPWGALLGVGTCWVGLRQADAQGEDALAALRARVAELGGIAPVVKGPGGLGAGAPAPEIHRRLKAALDPAGVLAPGRFWSAA